MHMQKSCIEMAFQKPGKDDYLVSNAIKIKYSQGKQRKLGPYLILHVKLDSRWNSITKYKRLTLYKKYREFPITLRWGWFYFNKIQKKP